MINPEKIEDWIREVVERPTSAANIIRYIANRLSELTGRNEELQAENIALRSGSKVEEYENRIANLEYQVELLKRQVGSAVDLPMEKPGGASTACALLVYRPTGQVMKIELEKSDLVSDKTLGILEIDEGLKEGRMALLATSSQEELLLVFDSGRTVTIAAADLPAIQPPDGSGWDAAHLEQPGGIEELAMIVPVAKMALFDFAIQVSRRGFVKKLRQDSFQAHLANNFIGTGTRLPPDRTCSLVLCNQNDLLVLSSREGFLLAMEAGHLPQTIEEGLRLSITDHLLTAFMPRKNSSILVMTENRKAIQRELNWLEPASSFKTRGQPVFSAERRQAGARVAGAAAVTGEDWGFALWSDGRLTVHRVSDILGAGSLPGEANLVSFCVYPG